LRGEGQKSPDLLTASTTKKQNKKKTLSQNLNVCQYNALHRAVDFLKKKRKKEKRETSRKGQKDEDTDRMKGMTFGSIFK